MEQNALPEDISIPDLSVIDETNGDSESETQLSSEQGDTLISETHCEDILVKTLQCRGNRHEKNLITHVNVNSLG